ncbi:hypothetical protein [Spirillospora sp. NPDC048819]|uniref:hypothetical protein n=1 Tax=Spirillospora sp. NPDC048819 TaxID=3155268 RepID=UPI0033F4CA71
MDPAACIVIEDAPAGIAAGRAAGATVLAVTTSHDSAVLTEAHRIIRDLTVVTATRTGLRLTG